MARLPRNAFLVMECRQGERDRNNPYQLAGDFGH